VHLVGEVHRRRAARQRDEVAARREAEDLVAVQLQPRGVEEFLRLGRLLEDLEQVLHPREALRSRAASPPCL
jgi:hypothetical protein